MARLDDWWDEATFAGWEQSSPGLPDRQTGYDRLVADGQVASLWPFGALDVQAVTLILNQAA
jgi:hypothetical protein